jgi:trk system potassium uptake protein TrkH
MLPDEANAEIAAASVFSILFLGIILLSAFVTSFFVPDSYSFFDILFEATSAQSTAGLSVGISDPDMHPIVESIYIFQMWIGRLEVIPVLALCRFAVFGSNPKTT